MTPSPPHRSASALARFATWLKALRERTGRLERRARIDASALDILAHNLPCQKADGSPAQAAACAGVVASADPHGRWQPFSFPCPCKHYGRSLSKYDALALVTFPWETVPVDALEASERTPPAHDAPWTECEEEAILGCVATRALTRFGAHALTPLPGPFDAVRDALDERQRGSARELGGIARATRVVRDAGHIVIAWSLIKDSYLAEFTAAAVTPALPRAVFAASVPSGAHALVAFDALMLKAYGARAPEVSALSAFLEDLFEKGCTLEGVSRYPLLGGAVPGARIGLQGVDDDLYGGFADGRHTIRDERGRLRVARRKKETVGVMSFEGALDRSDFEKLAQMILEGRNAKAKEHR